MRGMLLFAVVLAVGLSACSHNAQYSSGQAYLDRYQYQPAGAASASEGARRAAGQDGVVTGRDIDAAVARAAAIEPILRFPARIGLARIENGRLTVPSKTEGDAWLELAEGLGDEVGEFVLIDPLIASLAYDAATDLHPRGHRWSVQDAVAMIRVGAASQHVDAVFIYEVAATADSTRNPLSITDFTIVLGSLVPSRSVEAVGQANGILIDVRNGYPYGTAQATVDQKAASTLFGQHDKRRSLSEAARQQAAVALTGEVRAMIDTLKVKMAAAATP